MALLNGDISFLLGIIASVGVFIASIMPEFFRLSTVMKWLIRILFFGSIVCVLAAIILDSRIGTIFLSLGLGVSLLCKGLISDSRIKYVYFLLAVLSFLTEVLVYEHEYYFIIWLVTIYLIFISVVAQFLNVQDDLSLFGTVKPRRNPSKIIIVVTLLAIVIFIGWFSEYFYAPEEEIRTFSFSSSSNSIPPKLALAFILIMSSITLFIGFLYVMVMTKSADFLEVSR